MITHTLVRKDLKDGRVSILLHLYVKHKPVSVTTITTDSPGAAMKRLAEARIHLKRLGVPDNSDHSWGMTG